MEDLTISPEDAKKKLNNKNTFLLDVRNKDEYKISKIENAKLIPVNEIQERIKEIPKNKEIIIYCHHGTRSYHAAIFLKQTGYNAKSISGGIDAWSEKIDNKIPRY